MSGPFPSTAESVAATHATAAGVCSHTSEQRIHGSSDERRHPHSEASSQTCNENHKPTRIALIANDDFSMYHFRCDLIRSLVEKGHEVSIVVPPGEYYSRLTELGVRCHCVPMYRFLSPIRDLRLLVDFYRLFRRERFDLVHNMTIKPNIYGTFAARAAGIRNVVCLVSGMGLVFSDAGGLRARLLRVITSWLYWAALKLCRRTWFQNPDDRDTFVRRGLISRRKGIVIRSGGINLDEFSANSVSDQALDQLRDEIGVPRAARCVVMVTARLVWSKGVREFFEAARLLSSTLSGWKFVMLCPRDDDSWESVPEEYVSTQKPENLVLVDSFREDVKRFVALADIVVLPSFYPEGVPRTLLEALAMSKPIVTTDRPGCREVVDEGKNGFLIPVRDEHSLVERIELLAGDESLRSAFGAASREKANNEFSSELVVARIIEEIYLLKR